MLESKPANPQTPIVASSTRRATLETCTRAGNADLMGAAASHEVRHALGRWARPTPADWPRNVVLVDSSEMDETREAVLETLRAKHALNRVETMNVGTLEEVDLEVLSTLATHYDSVIVFKMM